MSDFSKIRQDKAYQNIIFMLKHFEKKPHSLAYFLLKRKVLDPGYMDFLRSDKFLKSLPSTADFNSYPGVISFYADNVFGKEDVQEDLVKMASDNLLAELQGSLQLEDYEAAARVQSWLDMLRLDK